MKNRKNLLGWASCLMLALPLLFSSCGIDDVGYGGIKGIDSGSAYAGESIGGQGDSTSHVQAGILTAGEWCDVENWDFWQDLIREQNDSVNFASYLTYWGFQTQDRIGIALQYNGSPLVNIPLTLQCDGKTIWSAKTDNRGRAELWLNLLPGTADILDSCRLYVNGEPKDVTLQAACLNTIDCDLASQASDLVQLAFVVDATGSMSDEMDFLKEDLMDVLSAVKEQNQQLRLSTASVFYRDEGDEYVVKNNTFTENIQDNINYISQQSAMGGGDYPEAVHKALDATVQLPWNSDARARIAFMLLDAPAHYQEDILSSLHRSVRQFAANGIKIIPVAASGVDKETEFMLRYFAMTTCGTYVFLTDDSGVGNSHLKPSVGPYEVKTLHELLQELILRYSE